jgi:hypothetical protein
MRFLRSVEFFNFHGENLVAVYAARQNDFEPVQHVKPSLRVMSLFCVLTSRLTDSNQSLLSHLLSL